MSRWLQLETVLLVLLAITAVLMFPAVRGPYTATHGPASVLRARFDAMIARLATALSACRKSAAAMLAIGSTHMWEPRSATLELGQLFVLRI
jgi:hypothetical protein